MQSKIRREMIVCLPCHASQIVLILRAQHMDDDHILVTIVLKWPLCLTGTQAL
jgi:hypothetical protein